MGDEQNTHGPRAATMLVVGPRDLTVSFLSQRRQLTLKDVVVDDGRSTVPAIVQISPAHPCFFCEGLADALVGRRRANTRISDSFDSPQPPGRLALHITHSS